MTFLGGRVTTHSDPLHIFSGVKTPNPRIYALTQAVDDQLWEGQHMSRDL